MSGLAGKTALVTGGARGAHPPPFVPSATRLHAIYLHATQANSQCCTWRTGIGFAVAQSLGVAGVRVFLADINEVGAQEAAARLQSEGVEAIGVGCDVGDKAQAREWHGAQWWSCAAALLGRQWQATVGLHCGANRLPPAAGGRGS